mmetsp:Transcript_13355/g.15211  ORF Transcript_13355/g.15211 Transcript_13355/m.15211 type:complete len:210 (-) Transcript_13355:190-819(-)
MFSISGSVRYHARAQVQAVGRLRVRVRGRQHDTNILGSKLFCTSEQSLTSQKRLIYNGPFGSMLSILKKVSVFSCGCTIIGVPLLSAFGNEKMSPIQRGAVGFTVCAFALGTTATLHFVCKPYITKLFLIQGSKEIEVHTLTLFGRDKITRLEGLAEISPAGDRVFSCFQNRAGTPFYVHEEEDMWGDTEFYTKLMEIIRPEEEETDDA